MAKSAERIDRSQSLKEEAVMESHLFLSSVKGDGPAIQIDVIPSQPIDFTDPAHCISYCPEIILGLGICRIKNLIDVFRPVFLSGPPQCLVSAINLYIIDIWIMSFLQRNDFSEAPW